MSTRDISWRIKAAGADSLSTFMSRLSRNSGSPNVLEPYGPVQGFAFSLYFSSFKFERLPDRKQLFRGVNR
jgi:hypothetical protein